MTVLIRDTIRPIGDGRTTFFEVPPPAGGVFSLGGSFIHFHPRFSR